jgi:hypothetical protein
MRGLFPNIRDGTRLVDALLMAGQGIRRFLCLTNPRGPSYYLMRYEERVLPMPCVPCTPGYLSFTITAPAAFLPATSKPGFT